LLTLDFRSVGDLLQILRTINLVKPAKVKSISKDTHLIKQDVYSSFESFGEVIGRILGRSFTLFTRNSSEFSHLRFKVREKHHQRARTPRMPRLLLAAAFSKWVLTFFDVNIPKKALPNRVYLGFASSTRDLLTMQQHLEASLLQSLRAESEVYLSWWGEHVAFAKLFRLWFITGSTLLFTSYVFSAPDLLIFAIIGNLTFTFIFLVGVPFLLFFLVLHWHVLMRHAQMI